MNDDGPSLSPLVEKLVAALPANHPLLPLVRADLEQRLATVDGVVAGRVAVSLGEKAVRPWWTRWFFLVPLVLLAVLAFSVASYQDLRDRPLQFGSLRWNPAFNGTVRPTQVDGGAPVNPLDPMLENIWRDNTWFMENLPNLKRT